MATKNNLFITIPFTSRMINLPEKQQKKVQTHRLLGGFFTSIDSASLEQDLLRFRRDVFLGYKINQLFSIREMKDISNEEEAPCNRMEDKVYLFSAQPINYPKAIFLLTGACLAATALIKSSSQPIETCWIGPFLLFSVPFFLQLPYQNTIEKWGKEHACIPYHDTHALPQSTALNK